MVAVKYLWLTVIAVGLSFGVVGVSQAQTAEVIGGQTSVLLDPDALSLAGLSISSVSEDVIAPGNLGGDSVAFPISARTDTPPTTFSYEPADFLNTFSGVIEHVGVVRFNNDALEAGDFTIGFDANRVGTLGGAASGFFVESNVGLMIPAFDLASPSTLDASFSSLVIEGDLLVSPELAQAAIDAGLTTTDTTGATAGQGRVDATAVPSPTTGAALLALSGVALLRRRSPRA